MHPVMRCLQLQPEFEHLYVCIKNIDADPEQLSQMERCILIEALIIVR